MAEKNHIRCAPGPGWLLGRVSLGIWSRSFCSRWFGSARRWRRSSSSLGQRQLASWTPRSWTRALWFLLSLSLVASSSTPGLTAPAGWSLTWNDEFNGTAVDASKWEPIFWTTPFNNERQAYHPARVTVAAGNLVLTADDANFSGKSYTSGKVESKFTQQHGRWEIRAKLPGTQGTWPALWLLPDTGTYPWPSQGEIDILENRGNQPYLTSSAFHYGADFQARQFTFQEQQATNGGQAENYHDEFHTYAVEWDATKLRFFVDDVHYQTVSNAETGGFLANQTAPVEINLNVAVGGDFLGEAQPDSSSVWPQQMLVDYVRVYERDALPPPRVFQNGSFEARGGSLAHWSTFGNVVPNVQTHHEVAAADGSEMLKLFGQFNGAQNFSGAEQGISVSAGDTVSASASALIRSADDLAGSNSVLMSFSYYNEFGGKFGSSSYLSSTSTTIADGNTTKDVWLAHQLSDTAPAGAVEARLSFVFVQPDLDGGAIHIDEVRFKNLDLAFNADADGDADVDGADFFSWQRGLGQDDGTSVAGGDFNFDGVVNTEDLVVWREEFRGAPAIVATQVPEPSSCLFVVPMVYLIARQPVETLRHRLS